MAVEDDQPPDSNLESREPTLEDLRDLCRERSVNSGPANSSSTLSFVSPTRSWSI